MIRLAGLSDAEGIFHLERTCFSSDLLTMRAIRYMLRNPQCKTLVYIKDGHIAGYTMTLCHARSRFARHYSVAVLPEHRGQHIAEALLTHAETLCAGKQGFKLEIRTDNAPAYRLYTRLGYKVSGCRKQYYEDNTDAYEMVKVL